MNRPIEIKRVGNREIDLSWDDRHESAYSVAYLRRVCPCAECLKARNQPKNPLRVVSGVTPESLQFGEVALAGNYALTISFSDGHSSGIFSFEYLREVCPCPACHGEGR